MKVKKIVSLWMIVGILFVGLAVTTAAQSEVLSITFGEPWKALFMCAIAEFEEVTGAVVDYTMVPFGVDMVKKVTLDLAVGVATDVIMVDSFMIPAWAAAGYLYPLDDYLAVWPDWDQYYPGMREIVSFQGVYYAVMIDTDVRMLWYWKPIFERAGIPMPWEPETWQCVIDTALIIQEKLPEVDAPLFIPMGTMWGEGTTMQGFYMVLLGADTHEGDRNRLRDWEAGKWIGSSPALLRALEFYRDVFVTYELSPIEPHYVPDVWGEWRRMMREGEIGIGLGGSWEWAEFWPVEIRPLVEERPKVLGWAPMPGSGYPDAPGIACISGGWAIAINAEARDPDLARQFIEILKQKERHAEWSAAAGKIAVRKDAIEVPAYAADEFLMKAIKLMEYTTFRDTYPTYTKVSLFVQAMTEDVAVLGLTPAEAMERFKEKLIAEFGADMVTTIPYP